MSATAPIMALPPSHVVLGTQAEIEYAIQQESGLSIENMPDGFRELDNYGLPVISADLVEFPLPNGKIDLRPRTIADVNGPQYQNDGTEIPGTGTFYYCWLSLDDKNQPSRSGYAFVKKDSPAAQGPNGERIPDHYFSRHGAIQRGSLFLCFARWNHAAEHKGKSRDYARDAARTLGPSGDLRPTDSQGTLLGAGDITVRDPNKSSKKRG